MNNKDFAVFILTHGRANNVKTYHTLKKQNFTGKIYFLCDDEDKELNIYQDNFGIENVFIFNKKESLSFTDDAMNDFNLNAVVYARNYAFILAKKLNLKTFLMLDDDYISFSFNFDKNGNYKPKKIKNLDKIFDIYIDYLLKANLDCVAFIQGGDLIGGKSNSFIRNHETKRKIMNAFFINCEKPFKFYGRINEDTTCYVLEGNIGKKFLTLPEIRLDQTTTQKNKGGLTDIYLDMGTYVKSFYTVLYCPSAVKVAMLNTSNKRLHHKIDWNKCCPMILNEINKKHEKKSITKSIS